MYFVIRKHVVNSAIIWKHTDIVIRNYIFLISIFQFANELTDNFDACASSTLVFPASLFAIARYLIQSNTVISIGFYYLYVIYLKINTYLAWSGLKPTYAWASVRFQYGFLSNFSLLTCLYLSLINQRWFPEMCFPWILSRMKTIGSSPRFSTLNNRASKAYSF